MVSTIPEGEQSPEVVPLKHWGRWAGVVAALIGLAMVVHTLLSKIPASNGATVCHVVNGVKSCQPVVVWRFGWNVVGQYLFDPYVMAGVWLTLQLTFWAMLIGIVLGFIVATMRLSRNRVMSGIAWAYTWFFRGTPVYIQLLFWFVIAVVYPQLSIGIPFLPISFVHITTATLFSPLNAAILGLGLNEAAYMSEVARAGMISIDEGQIEAATSVGMTKGQTMRFVVLPQAMRVIIPPTGNEVISMLKTSSLASAIGVIELAGAAQNIYAANLKTVPLLIVASLWYLSATTVLSIGQFYLERYFARGSLRTQAPTPIQRLRGDLKGLATRFRSTRQVVVQ
jgi:polar amino acid transport system permease protein